MTVSRLRNCKDKTAAVSRYEEARATVCEKIKVWKAAEGASRAEAMTPEPGSRLANQSVGRRWR